MASSCVCTSPLAVMTIAGLYDFVKVSISAQFKSFLLITCIDALESTTNFRSSGLRVDAGRHLFSEGEKNVALSCSFNLNTLLASLKLLHGHIALAILSLPETDPQILELGVTLMRFTWANHSERWILVSNVSMTYNGFCELNTSNRFPYV